MEKGLQGPILKYNKLIWKIVNGYVRRNPQLAGYREDFYQEGSISLLKVDFKEDDSDALAYVKALRGIKKGIRVYMRTFLGKNIERGYADKEAVTNPFFIKDLVNKRNVDSETGEEDLHEHICEQPSLERKDLLVKIHKAALLLLGGKEYTSVFVGDDQDFPSDEANRRRSNRHNAINKLKKHVEQWK